MFSNIPPQMNDADNMSNFDLQGNGKCRVQNAKCRAMEDFRFGRKSTIIEIVFVYKVNLF